MLRGQFFFSGPPAWTNQPGTGPGFCFPNPLELDLVPCQIRYWSSQITGLPVQWTPTGLQSGWQSSGLHWSDSLSTLPSPIDSRWTPGGLHQFIWSPPGVHVDFWQKTQPNVSKVDWSPGGLQIKSRWTTWTLWSPLHSTYFTR